MKRYVVMYYLVTEAEDADSAAAKVHEEMLSCDEAMYYVKEHTRAVEAALVAATDCADTTLLPYGSR